MDLKDFPRPPNDSGRGVHWSLSAYEWGKPTWDFWREQLLGMHIKWVKCMDDGGGSGLRLARQLVDVGIMPVVRLYRGPQQNPGTIGSRGGDAVKKYVAAGAMYFETNNEPDLDLEWKDGHKPANWLDIVVSDWIVDAGIVTDAGGYPAFPAFGVGTQRNPFALVKEKGRADLFDKGAWVACHNYALARPLEYPNDPVNMEGQPLTQQEWQAAGGMWAWETSLEAVNKARYANANPYADIMNDSTCFRAYEQVNALVVAEFGHSVPIMTTEGGYNVGQRAGSTQGDDVRYAKPTPQADSDLNLRMVRFMDGTETVLGKTVPDYYFASMPWLVAAYRIGVFAPPAENQGPWFTDKYNEEFGLHGELPLVQMLKNQLPILRQDGPVPHGVGWDLPPWEQELGDAWDNRLKYLGVKLNLAASTNDLHWKLVDAQWQDEDEVVGPGYIFIKALDINGNPIENATVAVARPDATDLVRTKGAIDGYWGNYAMRGTLGTYNVWMDGSPSDGVMGLGLGLEDNPKVWTRTSFRLVFQLTIEEVSAMFNHTFYNTKFLAQPGQNDSVGYGVGIQVVPGAEYHVIGVHHLLPSENLRNHHIFLDVLDAKGKRIQKAVVAWTWDGKKPGQNAFPAVLDKPDTEAGANLPLNWDQVASVWVDGATSDKVVGVTTHHADEIEQGMDYAGNTDGHHSFYVVFQKGVAVPVPPAPIPTPVPGDGARIAVLEAAISNTIVKLGTLRSNVDAVIESLKNV